jgi:phosphoglycolate phosphatase-like HAD superfamily hydrolase
VRLPRPLIFDLDDTLIQSFQTYVRLHQRVAGELGLMVPTAEALVPYLATWEETLLALWPGTDLTAFIERYDRLADDHPYPAVPGAMPALELLRARGHSLWIVTKRSRRRLHDRMRQAGLDEALFDGIFPFEDQPACKPDPRCFTPVWQALGDFAPRAIYVGDRSEDRQAAEAAGITFVAVLTGPEVAFGFPGDLASDAVIDSVAALPTRPALLEGSE